jgi:hypothetical protein
VEVLNIVKTLKNGKSSGMDGVINEYIKNSSSSMIDMYVELFNIIFDQGIFPDSWITGVIKPIYKTHNAYKLSQ